MKRLIILFTMVATLGACDFIYPIPEAENTSMLIDLIGGITLDQEFEVTSDPNAIAYYFKIVNEKGDENIFTTTRHSFALTDFDFFPDPNQRYALSYQIETERGKSRWMPIGQVTIDGSEIEFPCLTDELYHMSLHEEPELEQIYQQLVSDNQEWIAKYRSLSKKSSATCQVSYTIPVVFHVVYDPALGGTTGAGALTLSDIQAALNKLNADFSGSPDACIQFCLAQNSVSWTNSLPGAGGATTPGITRTANGTYTYVTQTPFPVHPESVIGFPTDKFLNIWIVEDIDFAGGFAQFPPTGGPKDGIVVTYEYINGNDPVLAHEAAHFLAVLHPFGVDGSNCNGTSTYPVYPGSESQWDHISDTPPQSQPTSYLGSCTPVPACFSGTSTIPTNIMDYSSFSCQDHFTQGQIDWMHATIQNSLPRQELVKMSNLLNQGVAGPNGCIPVGLSAEFNISPGSQLCAGTSTFDLQATASATAYDSWNFRIEDPNGVVTNYGSSGPSVPNVTNIGPFNTLGVWEVTLTVADAAGNQTTSSPSNIFVVSCTSVNSAWSDWYFGHYATLDFGSATVGPNPPSNSSALGSAASISDPATNDLLFYTNGVKIWNRQHSLMHNGNGIGGSLVATNGVLIVPHPDPSLPDQYFVFYNGVAPGALAGTVNGLRWSLVDMNPATNGGHAHGAVVMKDQAVPGMPWFIADYITAVPHANGSDYWILTQRMENGHTDEFYAYLLTNQGITSTPVMLTQSTVRAIFPQPGLPAYTHSRGSIDVTRDGNRIAIANSNTMYSISGNAINIYNFNRCTGELTNRKDIGAVPNSFDYASISFSPSGEFLYTHGHHTNIQQYDLRAINTCDIVPVQNFAYQQIYNPSIYSGGGLQLGPDDRLYVSHFDGDRVSVINFPDVPITPSNINAFGANMGAILLNSGAIGKTVLPNIIDASSAPPIVDFTYCIDFCNVVTFEALGCGSNYLWDFDHSGSIATTRDAQYTYPSIQGNYQVSLTVDNQTITKTISINGSAAPSIIPAQPVCANGGPFTYIIDPNASNNYPGAIFNWSISGGQLLTPATSQNAIVNWNNNVGSLTLTITDADGCQLSTSYTEYISTPPVVSLVSNNGVSNCNGVCDASVTVNATGGAPPYVFSWNDPAQQTGPSATNLCVGSYTVYVRDANNCEASLVVTVTEPTMVASANITHVSCAGGNDGVASLSVSGGSGPYNFQWQAGSQTNTQSGLAIGTHQYLVEDAAGCTATGQVVITEPTPLIVVATAICGGDATVIASGGVAPYTYEWNNDPALNTPTISLPPGNHQVVVTDANGCTSTSQVVVSQAQSPITLPYQYFGHGVDRYSDLYQDTFGNTYLALTFEDDMNAHGNYYPSTGCEMTMVAKFDDCDQLEWQYVLPMCATIGDGRDIMFVDSNGNLFLQALVKEYFQQPTFFGSSGLSQFSYHIFLFDNNGNPVMADDVSLDRQELTTNQMGHVITLHEKGDFNALGDVNTFPTNLMNYSINGYHHAQDIVTDHNNDLFVTGIVDNSWGPAMYNINISKYSGTSGFANVLWRQSFPASKFETINDAAILANGDIVVIGDSPNGFNLQGMTVPADGAFIMVLSGTNGAVSWMHSLSNATAKSIAVDLFDHVYVAGEVLNANGEFYLNKYDGSGSMQSVFTSDPNPTGEIRIGDLSVKSNGQIYLSGNIFQDVIIANSMMIPSPPQSEDIVLIRLMDNGGNISFARETRDEVSNEALPQRRNYIYPNPARNSVWLKFPKELNNVQLKVLNMAGQEVSRQFLKSTQESIDVADLDIGVYLMRIESDQGIYEERFVKI